MSEARDFFIQKMDAAAAHDIADRAEHGWSKRSAPAGVHTIGDLISVIMDVDNDDDARRIFEGHRDDIQAQMDGGKWQGQGTAEDAAKSNIGWCYGEGMAADRREMWIRVTNAAHPVFGKTMPTDPAEMFAAGVRAATSEQVS